MYYLGIFYNSRTQKYKVHDSKFNQIERRIKELEANGKVRPKEIASIVGKLIAFELATSYVPRLCCHQYFNWIAKVVETREHWDLPKRTPGKIIKSLKRALTFAKEFSGKITRKRHSYGELKHTDHNSARRYVKLAGDGNELYGAHYDVNSPFKYNVIKFEDYTTKDLSSSLRELLVLHNCVKRNAPRNKVKDLIYFTDSRVVYFWNLYRTASREIAELLIQIRVNCLRNDVILEIAWRPRENSKITLAHLAGQIQTISHCPRRDTTNYASYSVSRPK